MTLRERIGIDLGRKLPLEEGIAWAGSNDVHYVDAQIDIEPNALESFDDTRCRTVLSPPSRTTCNFRGYAARVNSFCTDTAVFTSINNRHG